MTDAPREQEIVEALQAHESDGVFWSGYFAVWFEREEDAVWAIMTFPEMLAG
jgi:hypothetical protein